MKKTILFLLIFSPIALFSQSFAWGVKGGLTAGFQKWNSFEQDPLFSYHGILYIESLAEDNSVALWAQTGYHLRGSAIRNTNFRDLSGNIFRAPTRNFEFRNAVLAVGAKQKKEVGNLLGFYSLGFRGEYTINTNLSDYDAFPNRLFYPFDDAVRRLNYGVTIGGGFEFMFTELVGGIVELTINPDFSKQYVQPAIPNVTNPWNGNPQTIAAREIRNVTAELTVGIRLLRIVEYID